jgi:type III pantothenate kinase
VLRIVADLGNSRLKWKRIGAGRAPDPAMALPVDDPDAWSGAWERWNPGGTEPASWAIASVNPPVAAQLGDFLDQRGIREIAWYRSAADVAIRADVDQPETAGADRALAVLGALAIHDRRGPGLIVSCGTAVTVERVSADGVWRGGAIAPGLRLSARALHLLTAQLPLVAPQNAPPAWGRSTRPAIEAGVFWSTVGTIRELLSRQAADLDPPPWVVWTGGDAGQLAPWIDGEDRQVVPDLVLDGLAQVAFPAP